MNAAEAAQNSTRVFLSHAGADATAARAFAEILRHNGVDVWFDRDNLLPGDRWMEALEGAIQTSSGMLVYVDRLAVQNWVDREVRFGLELNTRDPNAFKVIPVFGDGADIERLPPFLRQHQGIAASDPEAIQRLLNVLQGGKATPAVPSEYWATHSPFRSLQAFAPDDAWLFFGRDRDTSELLQRLQRSRVIIVIGNSGSGKSSLVRAGLIPALHRGRFCVDEKAVESWNIAVVRPGADPFGELVDRLPSQLAPGLPPADRDALITRWRETFPDGGHAVRSGIAALSAEPERTLLFVDQFEELFTLAPERVRKGYIDALLSTTESEGVHLILGLRADFYANCVSHEQLLPYLQNNYSLSVMKPDQLREAIEKRLALAAARAEEGLTDALLGDAGTEPGNLALLEHALALLWERNIGKYASAPLTNKRYDEIGRLKGAIGKHAQAVYTGLTPDQQRLARRMFLELVHLGEGAQDTRRRVSKTSLLALAKPGTGAPILEILAAKRLIATGAERAGAQTAFVEVSHEALIREWADLRRWVDEDRENLRFGRRLSSDSEQWDRTQDSSVLLRGALLVKAKEWLTHHQQVPEEVRAFVDASDKFQKDVQAERESQLAQIATAQARTARAQRFSKWLLATVAIGLLATGAAIAFQNREVSRERSRVLVGNSEDALERRAYERAVRLAGLAAASTWLSPSAPEAESQLARVGYRSPQLVRLSHDGAVRAAAFSRDGQRIVTASDTAARVWDASSGKEVTRLLHGGFVRSAAFSQDGQRIVTASDTTARVWDASSGKVIAQLAHPYAGILTLMSAAFSQDGQRIVTASRDNRVRVWDASSGKEMARLLHDDNVWSAAFSQDGQRIVTASVDNTARVWNASNGKEIARLLHDDDVWSAAFSQDGQRIVTASVDNTARLWDGSNGKEIARLLHDDDVRSAVFSQDGQRIVTASVDNTARLWDGSNGKEIARLLHDDDVRSAVFSQDGQRIVTASVDNTARLWDGSNGKEIARFLHDDDVWSAAFSQDGQRIVTASVDNTARVWDASRGKEMGRLVHDNYVSRAAFSQDGQHIVTAGWDDPIRVWDALGGKEIAHVPPGNKGRLAALSRDGQRIVTTSVDNTARVWDASNGKEVVRLTHDGDVRSAAFSQDGRRIVTASDDNTARVWDASNGKEIVRLLHNDNVWSARFSEDGRRIVTESSDLMVRIWDASSGQVIARLPHDVRFGWTALSPDGQRIVTAPGDETARVWDASSGKEIARLHDDDFSSAAFSPDGQRIVTPSRATVRVWDASNGKEVVRLTHDGDVRSAAFSQDGRRIVTASDDNTARVWDASNGREIGRLPHDDDVSSAAFSQDGQRIVTASDDRTVRIWDSRWLTRYGAELLRAVCSQRLIGARRISASDISAAPILFGREGEDVCHELSASERLRTWLQGILDQLGR